MKKSSRAALAAAFGLLSAASLALFGGACGGDDSGSTTGGSAANRLGLGADCETADDCEVDGGQTCLASFKGGYCGVEGCAADTDCPAGSACVAHVDGHTYCFLLCTDKAQCNDHRSADTEANCSSNVTFVEPAQTSKACVPPS